jgi:hypothetical protein
MSGLALGPTHLHIQCILWALSPHTKMLSCDVNHSLTSTAEVKNGGNYYIYFPCLPSWHRQEQPCVYLYVFFISCATSRYIEVTEFTDIHVTCSFLVNPTYCRIVVYHSLDQWLNICKGNKSIHEWEERKI